MLTRLKVDGFKSLVDVDVRLGPFTCVAGANGVGKSNLFDAITFLSDLADKTLVDAALSVRGERGKSADVRGLFHLAGGVRATQMSFEAEIIAPSEGVDDLGQRAKATTTLMRYGLVLGYRSSEIRVLDERLEHVTKGQARRSLRFVHTRDFRDSLGIERRTRPFISTEHQDGTAVVQLHEDTGREENGGQKRSGAKPRRALAASLPRTVLSSTTAAESPTALLARREMQSWRLLQLEPSALRSPDPYNAPTRIDSHGAHMPATLTRLMHLGRQVGVDDGVGTSDTSAEAAAVQARVANRLAELIDGVGSVSIDADDRRELFTLVVQDLAQTPCEARALSDGTLRFLALAIIENDSESRGLLCLEEPENGIHPERIPAMLRLLQDICVDPQDPIGADNPLRQVIVNTHSPLVVAQLPDDCLLMARGEPVARGEQRFLRTNFRWLDGTWRAQADSDCRPVSKGELLSYLNPIAAADSDMAARAGRSVLRRVIDRPELQPCLPVMLQAPDA